MKLTQFALAKILFFFIIGITTSYYLKTSLTVLIILFLLIFALLIVSFFQKKRNTFISLLIPSNAYILGILVTFLHTATNQYNHYYQYHKAFEKEVYQKLEINEKLKSTKKNQRYIAKIISLDNYNYTGKIILVIQKSDLNKSLHSGSVIYLKSKLAVIESPKNPYQFDYAKYLEKKQIYAQVYTNYSSITISNQTVKNLNYYSDYIRKVVTKRLEKNGIKNNELAIISALILGQRQDLNPDIEKNYQLAGATHILSVSGLHVGFIIIFLNIFLQKLPRTRTNRLFELLVILSCLTLFTIISGLSPSILRASIMFSFLAIANYYNRLSNIYHTLIISAFLILIFDPYSLFDVGFQLSYLAVIFIVWMQPLYLQFRPKNTLFKKSYDIISVSISAQIGTLPLCLFYFHQFPGLFLITNLVVIPFVSIIMFLGILTIFFTCIGYAPQILIFLLNFSIQKLNLFVSWIANCKEFIFQNIAFSYVFLILTFVIIISCISYFQTKKRTYLQVCLLAVICLQSWTIFTKIKQEKQEEFIIFNSKKNTVLAYRMGREIKLYSPKKEKDFIYENQDYIRENQSRVQNQPLQNYYFFKNKKILLVDSNAIPLKSENPDYLILTQSTKINLDRLIQESKPKHIIVDNSNYKKIAMIWKKTCEKRKIPFHYTNEMGYYKID